jgi:hypothetical protein
MTMKYLFRELQLWAGQLPIASRAGTMSYTFPETELPATYSLKSPWNPAPKGIRLAARGGAAPCVTSSLTQGGVPGGLRCRELRQ